MNKITLAKTVIFLGILLAALHTFALSNFLYFHIAWLDIVMHFLGGFFISLLGILLLKRFKDYYLSMSRARLIIDIILFTFIVGIFWEIYELLFAQIFASPDAYVIDTIVDILMGTVGAIFGLYLVVTDKFKKI